MKINDSVAASDRWQGDLLKGWERAIALQKLLVQKCDRPAKTLGTKVRSLILGKEK